MWLRVKNCNFIYFYSTTICSK